MKNDTLWLIGIAAVLFVLFKKPSAQKQSETAGFDPARIVDGPGAIAVQGADPARSFSLPAEYQSYV